jgi:hypothetical protein
MPGIGLHRQRFRHIPSHEFGDKHYAIEHNHYYESPCHLGHMMVFMIMMVVMIMFLFMNHVEEFFAVHWTDEASRVSDIIHYPEKAMNMMREFKENSLFESILAHYA